MTQSGALLSVFHSGMVVPFVRGYVHSRSQFGGPLEWRVSGATWGPRPLHQIALLSMRHLQLPFPGGAVSEIPLLYGLCFSGCEIAYGFNESAIDVAEIEPITSNEDWPYVSYPDYLPYIPLAPVDPEKRTWHDFAREFENLPLEQPAEVVIVVPPPANIGFSVWGRDGDAEGVTIVFEYSPVARRVKAYNVCS